MLSSDLALLYQVPPRMLVQAVKRKIERFPPDFMFQLSPREFRNLKSQNGTSSWGGTRKPPYAFTGKGVVMLSGVLRSQRAISVSIEIMRSVVRSPCVPDPHEELACRLPSLEENHDPRFKIVFDVIAEMMIPPSQTAPPPVFHAVRPSPRTIETLRS